MSLQLVVEAYRTLLTPFGALETLTGARLSPLDVLGALRLALVMRQLRDAGYDGVPAHRRKERESKSFVKDLAVLMVVVYGGEAFTGPLLPLSRIVAAACKLTRTCAHLPFNLVSSSMAWSATLFLDVTNRAVAVHGRTSGDPRSAERSAYVPPTRTPAHVA